MNKIFAETRVSDEFKLDDTTIFDADSMTLYTDFGTDEEGAESVLDLDNDYVNTTALDQLILAGHYLYYLNEDFRKDYIDTFGWEMQVVDKKMRQFFFQDYFHVMFYGTVVTKYFLSIPEKPKYYFERASTGSNISLQEYIKEAKETDPKFQIKPGVPFYCYQRTKSKMFLNAASKAPMIMCPVIDEYKRAKKYAVEIQKLSQRIIDRLIEIEPEKTKELLDVFASNTWSPYLKAYE